MVSVLRVLLDHSRYQRLASLATTTVCILCCIPHSGSCCENDSNGLTREILQQADLSNADSLINQFDRIEENIASSSAPIEEGRKFFQSFINEINTRHGMNLTVPEACMLVRANLHNLEIPIESKELLLKTIDLIANSNSTPSQIQDFEKVAEFHRLHFYWPWEWKWFGWNQKHKHGNEDRQALNIPMASLMKEEVPGNCIFGGIEFLAGVVVVLLPFPGAQWLGGVMMGDGVRRVVDGAVQLSDERRADPDFANPQPPF